MKTKSTAINFSVSKEDRGLIERLVKRAIAMNMGYDIMDCRMDLTACHANGCPLDLNKLLEADDFNFAHDVFGIRRHINRETGELMDCFRPRCAL